MAFEQDSKLNPNPLAKWIVNCSFPLALVGAVVGNVFYLMDEKGRVSSIGYSTLIFAAIGMVMGMVMWFLYQTEAATTEVKFKKHLNDPFDDLAPPLGQMTERCPLCKRADTRVPVSKENLGSRVGHRMLNDIFFTEEQIQERFLYICRFCQFQWHKDIWSSEIIRRWDVTTGTEIPALEQTSHFEPPQDIKDADRAL